MARRKMSIPEALEFYQIAIPPFETGTWWWDGEAHYEGNRVRQKSSWLARRAAPFRPSGNSGRSLAGDFEVIARNRFLFVVESFHEVNDAIREYIAVSRGNASLRELEALDASVTEELEVLRRSFERGNNHPFRVFFTKEVLSTTDEPLYELDEKIAKLFFQIDQLRNCAEENSRAYTIEQLDVIYSRLARLLQQLRRNIKGTETRSSNGSL